jgi:hypothetical protein
LSLLGRISLGEVRLECGLVLVGGEGRYTQEDRE